MTGSVAELMDRWVRSGSTVVIADGVGAPARLCRALSEVAATRDGVRLILGWCPELPEGLDLAAFGDVRSFMPGAALRQAVVANRAHYVPAYLSQLPALFAGPWRPDVLLLGVRQSTAGLNLATEASWIAAAARTASICIAELNEGLPAAARGSLLNGVDVTVALESNAPPLEVPARPAGVIDAAIAAQLAPLLTGGVSVQYGPGPLAEALLAALDEPVRIDSGILTDAVVGLAERGLLRGTPTATYLSGTRTLYEWADGRQILSPIEHTHDTSRLARERLVAVNTALQIDLLGQVALEAPRGRAAGIGGHTDYAYAASRARGGLSVIALPTVRGGRPTLVEHLDLPVATPRSAVDVVVTEHGRADLRGLGDTERAAAIRAVYPDLR